MGGPYDEWLSETDKLWLSEPTPEWSVLCVSSTEVLAILPPTPQPADALEPVLFLAGHWRSESSEELWSVPEQTQMLGLGRSLGGGSFFEYLRIEVRSGDLVYVAAPGGGPSTEFWMAHSGPNSAVFENPAHDFPQRIRYAREGETLRAVAEDLEASRQLEFEWQLHAIEVTEELR